MSLNVFNITNPSDRTMTLGLSHTLTEMSIKKYSWGRGKVRQVVKADNLTTAVIVWKIWQPRRITTRQDYTSCYGDSFTFLLLPIIQLAMRMNLFYRANGPENVTDDTPPRFQVGHQGMTLMQIGNFAVVNLRQIWSYTRIPLTQ
jgi:hypothetical protein